MSLIESNALGRTNSTISAGIRFAITLITPVAPTLISGSVMLSSPERIVMSHAQRSALAESTDPVACLTATMRIDGLLSYRRIPQVLLSVNFRLSSTWSQGTIARRLVAIRKLSEPKERGRPFWNGPSRCLVNVT